MWRSWPGDSVMIADQSSCLSRRPVFVMFGRAGSVSDGQRCPSLTLPARQKKRSTTTATCLEDELQSGHQSVLAIQAAARTQPETDRLIEPGMSPS